MSQTPKAQTMLPLKPPMFLVLLVLSGGERHGYSIVKEIERRAEGPRPRLAGLENCWRLRGRKTSFRARNVISRRDWLV